jgi:hypothetical protein
MTVLSASALLAPDAMTNRPKHVRNGNHQLEFTPATSDADAVMVSDKPRVKQAHRPSRGTSGPSR